MYEKLGNPPFRELFIAPEKSTVTWFIPATAETQVQLIKTINGKDIKLDKNLKLLRISFDTMSCFGPHIKQTIH